MSSDRATLPDVTGPIFTYIFTVAYPEMAYTQSQTLGSTNHIRVNYPMAGQGAWCSLVSVADRAQGGYVATYRLPAPGGNWDPTDNGTYRFELVGNTIKKFDGSWYAGENLGNKTFNLGTATFTPTPTCPTPTPASTPSSVGGSTPGNVPRSNWGFTYPTAKALPGTVAVTLNVNGASGADTNDGQGSPVKTLKRALELAGGVTARSRTSPVKISISDGVYNEEDLNLPDNVFIEGASMANTEICARFSRLNVKGVTLHRFKMRANNGQGNFINWGGVNENLLLRSLDFDGSNNNEVMIWNAKNVEISKCKFVARAAPAGQLGQESVKFPNDADKGVFDTVIRDNEFVALERVGALNFWRGEWTRVYVFNNVFKGKIHKELGYDQMMIGGNQGNGTYSMHIFSNSIDGDISMPDRMNVGSFVHYYNNYFVQTQQQRRSYFIEFGASGECHHNVFFDFDNDPNVACLNWWSYSQTERKWQSLVHHNIFKGKATNGTRGGYCIHTCNRTENLQFYNNTVLVEGDRSLLFSRGTTDVDGPDKVENHSNIFHQLQNLSNPTHTASRGYRSLGGKDVWIDREIGGRKNVHSRGYPIEAKATETIRGDVIFALSDLTDYQLTPLKYLLADNSPGKNGGVDGKDCGAIDKNEPWFVGPGSVVAPL